MTKTSGTPEYSRQRQWHIDRAKVRKAAARMEFSAASEMGELALWTSLERRLENLELYLRDGASVEHYGDVRIAIEVAAEIRHRGTQLGLGGF